MSEPEDWLRHRLPPDLEWEKPGIFQSWREFVSFLVIAGGTTGAIYATALAAKALVGLFR